MNLANFIFESLNSDARNTIIAEATSDSIERRLNAQQFRSEIAECVDYLHSMGIRERVLVPLFLDNSIDFILIFLALIHMKAVPVIAKRDYRDMELTEIFRNSDPDIVIAEHEHIPVLEKWLTGKTVLTRLNGVWKVLQRGPEKSRSSILPDDVATINYTYRGYGYPLGAMVTHWQYIHGAQMFPDSLLFKPGDSMLVILPMSHIFTLIGCVVVPLLYQLTALVAQSLHPRNLFTLIEKESIEYLLAVPEFYELLYRVYSGQWDIGSLRAFISGGSYLSSEKYHDYSERFGVEILHGYGLTEFTPASRSMLGSSRPGTIGIPCEGVNFLFDDGEILLDTPHISKGYYRRDTETAEAFHGNYFRTGDLGHMDQGHIVFDREKKRTRKINGNIVDLAEVESAIASFPGIDYSSVDYQGGRLYAALRFCGKSQNLRDELRRYLLTQISRYKVPILKLG